MLVDQSGVEPVVSLVFEAPGVRGEPTLAQ